ncbi:MAG: UDP-N-acetylmuramate--L-alanine ligase [Anaerolineales bacterium]
MKGSTHFIGIGGTGLSAIARVLLERGEQVSGSDREESGLAQALRQAGALVHIGHAASHVNGAARVIRSSAIGDDNVEVQAARAKGIPVLKRAEFLNELLANQQVIAVAGSHGKTTTTAMIAWMLTALNERPGFIIGSVAQNLGANAAAGAGRLFVIEADEYDYMFLGLAPKLALVTNVEHDHPDMFPTAGSFSQAFRDFVDRLQPEGILLACSDDPGARELLVYGKSHGKATYSYSHSHKDADYLATDLNPIAEKGFSFVALRGGKPLGEVHLQVPGLHNVSNALGALALADLLSLPLAEATLALSDFRGTARRFEIRGEARGVLIVNDYAHHPTEIRSTLAAARARYPGRRLWAVWQPHTYSRTRTLWGDFAAAFTAADRVLVTGVYAAREEAPTGFKMGSYVESMEHPAAHYVNGLDAAGNYLISELQAGDVAIVMSAGDAINLSERVFNALNQKESPHA